MASNIEYFNREISSPGLMPGDGRFVGRFAPSPSGRMHAGNIFSALVSWLIANRSGGGIVLRIEDLDASRSKTEYVEMIMRDFEMLGLGWDKGPFFQNNRWDVYHDAFNAIKDQGLTYPCFCTRADLHAASAPHQGEKLVYAGTCRSLTAEELEVKYSQAEASNRNPSQRIIVPDSDYGFDDLFQGFYSENLERDCGDFVIQRTDGAFAYQLAVVVDDYEQGISCVVRGCDLLSSTPQQLFIHELLGFDAPAYAHVPLVMGSDGHRLSKRHADADIEHLMFRFKSPQAVLGHIAYIGGMIPDDVSMTADELLKHADMSSLRGVEEILWK